MGIGVNTFHANLGSFLVIFSVARIQMCDTLIFLQNNTKISYLPAKVCSRELIHCVPMNLNMNIASVLMIHGCIVVCSCVLSDEPTFPAYTLPYG